jgi:hypothetical protein
MNILLRKEFLEDAEIDSGTMKAHREGKEEDREKTVPVWPELSETSRSNRLYRQSALQKKKKISLSHRKENNID